MVNRPKFCVSRCFKLLKHSEAVPNNIYVSLERSPLDEANKKHKIIEKAEMSKMPKVNPLF